MAQGKRNTIGSILQRIQQCNHIITCYDCCWHWLGSCDRYGYGKVIYNGIITSPHRIIYQAIMCVTLQSHELVLHKCDVKTCCNWNHLYIGDKRQNAIDAVQRGQSKVGEQRSNAKLTVQQVREIRHLYNSGQRSQKELTAIYPVGKSTIQRIVTGEDWRGV